MLPYLVNVESDKFYVGPNPQFESNKAFHWKFLPLTGPQAVTVVRTGSRMDRAAPCLCGSGLPYNDCHGDPMLPPTPEGLRAILGR